MNTLSLIFITIAAFAACNVGELFILISFYLDRRFSAREVILGQFLSGVAIMGVCTAVAFFAATISPIFLRALGILPIFIGIRNLMQGEATIEAEEEEEKRLVSRIGTNILSVAAVTFADGSDNLGVFAPIFAANSTSPISITIIMAVFFIMIGVLCALSHYLMHHKHVGALLRRFGVLIAPIALILIGLFIIFK